MKPSSIIFITITAIIVLCCAGCTTVEEPPSTEITGGDQLEEYMHNAAVYARSVDKDEHLRHFPIQTGHM